MTHRYLWAMFILLFGGCTAGTTITTSNENSSSSPESIATPNLGSNAHIDAARLSEIVKVLASDDFEGRAPGTPGEEKTIAFLEEQFSQIGLEPGGENGSWTQAVPLIHTQIEAPAAFALSVNGERLELRQEVDVEISTVQAVQEITLSDTPVVFVGYGTYAPERAWDDFGDIDLTGKVALFLVNDPDFAAEPDEAVSGRFGNRRMTYYGRWMYKFEEAARRGAAAALVIHETQAAGYGWNVASSSPGENYAIPTKAGATKPIALQGWMHGDMAAKVFAQAGLDLQEQMVLARNPDFKAFELTAVTMSADLTVSMDKIISQNVLGLLPGTSRADETIMLSAHWDAYGMGKPDAQGRTVRPGANDDALGTAGIMEIARVLKNQPPLERSVVIAAWTAEESGLLGSAAYATNPVYPVEKTVANLTLDILQTAGLSKDVILVGEGQSELEEELAKAAQLQGRTLTPESLPENGLFFRADHFSMARVGVPVLLLMGIAGGADLVNGGREAGDQWVEDYIGNCYHQTCDAWDADWDLSGAVQDIELFLTITQELGNSEHWPQWMPESEFKAIRDESEYVRHGSASR